MRIEAKQRQFAKGQPAGTANSTPDAKAALGQTPPNVPPPAQVSTPPVHTGPFQGGAGHSTGTPHTATQGSQASAQYPAAPTTKRLYRSTNEKMVAGVCGGIAEHFNADPVVVRLLTVLLTLITAGAPVPIAYIIAWIVIPEKPAT